MEIEGAASKGVAKAASGAHRQREDAAKVAGVQMWMRQRKEMPMDRTVGGRVANAAKGGVGDLWLMATTKDGDT